MATLGSGVTVGDLGRLDFTFAGSSFRQLISFRNGGLRDPYGIGVQIGTVYFRTGANFAWFLNGEHTNTTFDAGNNGTVRMVLLSNGNLGLGTTAPAYRLDVDGDINASGRVRASGVALTSDARLKRHIRPSAYGLATVLGLRPVQYEKRASLLSADYGRAEIGFVAQQVRELLPGLVSEGPGPDRLLAVSYVELIPVLTRAIQEQQAQLGALRAENERLRQAGTRAEASLQSFEQRLRTLESGAAPAAATAQSRP